MVAVHSLQPVTVFRQEARQADENSNFGDFLRFYIRLPISVFFLFLMLYLMLDGLMLFHKGDFCHVRCF